MGVGVDCIGIIGMSAIVCGVPGAAEWWSDRAMHNYARTPNAAHLVAACERFMDRVPLAEIKIADVLYFRYETEPQHFALVTRVDPLYVIHAYAQVGRVVEQGGNIANAHIMRAYRMRGVA